MKKEGTAGGKAILKSKGQDHNEKKLRGAGGDQTSDRNDVPQMKRRWAGEGTLECLEKRKTKRLKRFPNQRIPGKAKKKIKKEALQPRKNSGREKVL